MFQFSPTSGRGKNWGIFYIWEENGTKSVVRAPLYSLLVTAGIINVLLLSLAVFITQSQLDFCTTAGCWSSCFITSVTSVCTVSTHRRNALYRHWSLVIMHEDQQPVELQKSSWNLGRNTASVYINMKFTLLFQLFPVIKIYRHFKSSLSWVISNIKFKKSYQNMSKL